MENRSDSPRCSWGPAHARLIPPLPPPSRGTASFGMEPSHYAPVKEELADLRAAS
jgi:hypothetical protein